MTQVCGCAFFCGIVILRFHVDSTGRLGNLAYYDANDFAMLAVCTLPLAIYFARRPGKALWRLLAQSSALSRKIYCQCQHEAKGKNGSNRVRSQCA